MRRKVDKVLSSTAMKEKKKLLRSPLRYPGGKQRAIKEIAKHLPEHAREYREPMVGGGSVYFHLRQRAFAETYWINDKFTDLVEFWRASQDEGQCLRLRKELLALKSELTSAEAMKDYFQRTRKLTPEDPFEKALLFFFFNRVTFSGTTKAGGFSTEASKKRFTFSSIERLTGMPAALAGVKITNLDVESVISEPGDDVFIFLDPPYYRAERLYGKDGSLHSFDHARLAQVLKETGHRFLITYDDCEEIRQLYKWARIKSWRLQYGMNNCNKDKTSKIGDEILVCNYDTVSG